MWVDHFRKGDVVLTDLLEHGDVVMHPFVVGEIACGSLANRALIMELLQQLPAAMIAEADEALGYIEPHKLYDKGLGYVDVHLLAPRSDRRDKTLDARQKVTRRRARARLRLRRGELTLTSGVEVTSYQR